MSMYNYVYVSSIYVTLEFPSLSVFADEFAVTDFNGSLSLTCGDFNSCECFLSLSLSHQNVVDISTRLDIHLNLVLINDV